MTSIKNTSRAPLGLKPASLSFEWILMVEAMSGFLEEFDE